MPFSLFRRKKREKEQAPPAAAAPEPAPEVLTVDRPADSQAADGQLTAPRKRRRGSRGGRGRKKPAGSTDAATATATAVAVGDRSVEERQPGAARKPAERKQGGGQRTRAPRRTPPKRAPLPKAKRELVISVDAGEKRVAVLEDGVVAEVYLERPGHRSIAGNIYFGTVDTVLPGMEAAFVEIGLEKNGFLYVDEIVGPELEGRKGARKIQDLIQRGQTILVQAVKDPMKTKGARLTTEISLPGRFVVYVPHGDGLGVSRRLDDDERNRLKAIVKEIAPEQGGVIVRTAAEGASAEDVARDLDFLERLWKTIEARAKGSAAPALIYQEAELPLRVTRDLFTGDFERLLVDHERAHKRIVGYLKKTSPHMVERVVRYKDRPPLMEAFGVEQEIRSTLNRRVDLPSGGYLIFDYAEAFTVIDVNTGRFVGSRSKKSEGRLEDTITKNNLEAVKEVVRQLRLRDVGGIIVIDFIDMANPKNRAQVEEALRQELERDRTKTYVVEISPLGLVEMTRQNVTDGPREVMTRKCPTCAGDGIVVSDSTTALEIERKLRALPVPGSRTKAFKVELNARIASLVAGPAAAQLHELEETAKGRFFLVGVEGVHLDHFRVLEQGTVEKLAPTAPVEVGQELELKLGQVGLYDPQAGVAKVDGIDVSVAGAAKLVGKKVRAQVTAVLEGIAYAELLDGHVKVEPPITAEGEAEKPTRTRRSSKAKAGAEADTAASGDVEEFEDDVDLEIEAEVGLEEDVAAVAEGDEDVVPLQVIDGEEATPASPKKRTRRGSRGGRNRRSSSAARTAAEGDGTEGVDGAEAPTALEEAAEESVAPEETSFEETSPEETSPARQALPGPVIHVPVRELGDAGDEASKDGASTDGPAKDGTGSTPTRTPTRRGSRGGRNRRKKPAGVTATAEGTATAEVAVAEKAPPSGNGSEPKLHGPELKEPKPKEPKSKESEPGPSGEWEYTPMSEWGDR